MTLSNYLQGQTGQTTTRRDFMKFCSLMAGVLALPRSFTNDIAKALEATPRTPVIWLELQDCAGCTEALLRASRPSVGELVLDYLSVDYHETIMAAAGNLAEEAKQATIKAGNYLLVVEGSIPLKDNGVYCCVGGKSATQLLDEAIDNSIAIVAVGNCATFGGIPKANPNPTGAVSVMDYVKDRKPVLNLSGCPYNPVNLTATVVHFLTFGALPAMDKLGRPLFAYGARIHDNCERRGHFDAGEFVVAWGDEGHKNGWCLYKMGCKGPLTFHNCPAVRYNDGTSWPVQSGHGCIGCSEPDFWEWGVYNQVTEEQLKQFGYAPPTSYAPVQQPAANLDPFSAGVIGAVAGVAVGAAGVAAYKALAKPDEPEAAPSGKK